MKKTMDATQPYPSDISRPLVALLREYQEKLGDGGDAGTADGRDDNQNTDETHHSDRGGG